MKAVGVITRAESVSVSERQNALELAEKAGEIRFGVSLYETRDTGPSSWLIASCCGKAGYGDALGRAQS